MWKLSCGTKCLKGSSSKRADAFFRKLHQVRKSGTGSLVRKDRYIHEQLDKEFLVRKYCTIKIVDKELP